MANNLSVEILNDKKILPSPILMREAALQSRKRFQLFLTILLWGGVLTFVVWVGGSQIRKSSQGGYEKLEKDVLGFTSQENPRIKEVQTLLREKGFDAGVSDGKMSDQLRGAVRKYQELKKIPVTGYIDSQTFSDLYRFVNPPAKVVRGVSAGEKKISKVNTPTSKEVAKSPIKDRYPKDFRPRRYSQHILDVQKALKNAGLDPGPMDGKMGKKTKEALRRFQSSHGLKSDGVIGEKTWTALTAYVVPSS